MAEHAGALAAAAPAALAASSEAQKLLTGGDPVAKTEAPATTQAPSGDLSDGVKTLAEHAGALAAAAPAALAAAGEAQKLLTGDDADAKAEALATQASSGDLADGVKTLAEHAASLAAAAPAALAAAGEAQKLLAGDQGGDASAKTEAPGTSKAFAAAAPAALEATTAAQDPLAKSPSPPPAMERPAREKDEDRLGQIEGVGKKLTRKLQDIGVWRFEQIAAWTPEQAAWFGAQIGEPGRVESENWIAQARLLAETGKTWTPGVNGSHDAASGEKSKSEAIAPPAAPRPERAGDEDDLRLIRGIGDRIAGELRDLGVWRFSQIAAWTPAQQDWIGEKLGRHSGPVARKYWVAQAQMLAAGVETDHSRALREGEAGADSAAKPLDEAAAAALHAALPEVIAPHANDEIYAGLRPLSLLQPPFGEKDDLAAIEGVGDRFAERLHALGVWTFAQIAGWSDENARWIGSYLAFPGRVQRERWVEQARALAAKKRLPG